MRWSHLQSISGKRQEPGIKGGVDSKAGLLTLKGFMPVSFQVVAFRAGDVERVGRGEEVPVVRGAVVV